MIKLRWVHLILLLHWIVPSTIPSAWCILCGFLGPLGGIELLPDARLALIVIIAPVLVILYGFKLLWHILRKLVLWYALLQRVWIHAISKRRIMCLADHGGHSLCLIDWWLLPATFDNRWEAAFPFVILGFEVEELLMIWVQWLLLLPLRLRDPLHGRVHLEETFRLSLNEVSYNSCAQLLNLLGDLVLPRPVST